MDSKAHQELSKALYSRQKLDSQLQETQMVLSEISSVTGNQVIYKAFGPALLVQEQNDAINILQKRADFIKNELKSLDSSIDNLNAQLKRKVSSK